MPAVAVVTIWWTVGFNVLLFLAGLQNISRDVYEASSIDGASAFQQFIYITCPLMWPVTSLVLILQLIAQFKIFDQVYLFDAGRALQLHDGRAALICIARHFSRIAACYASAVAIALVVIMLIISAIQFRALQGDAQNERKARLDIRIGCDRADGHYGLGMAFPGLLDHRHGFQK